MSAEVGQRRRGLRVALITLAAVLLAGALAFVGWIAWIVIVVGPFGDPDDYGYHRIDEQAAVEAMDYREVAIPDGFQFEQMTALIQFSGADSYWGRYRAPGTFEQAAAAVAAANPAFPALRSTTCDDDVVARGFTRESVNDGYNGPVLECAADTRLAVTTAWAGSPGGSLDNWVGTPADAETLLVVGAGNRVELWVLSQGH
ncbi:hypothetical protein [Mycolicibacterium brumae]|uniref:Uncharacterized protein n=1 Tax=Mycolicibacterium brumae TaxID=85968 RepID=A0A2G5PGM5_9MYCO|nr:hypothetical protein [Mycolicibacterium brumae]MCV7192535.1 hypothetical protein [Mycolicibacterium brumae]PIB77469.1 hypothetical protein CQY22_000405 [Mycolicibacterium brumae]RWA18472.1 hypothetical protein MBRU_04450 [Mycolicibacterium brumae DSM 44177]UWW10304.1 hypothetical protein L2Z93_003432 [Mycolicibacterium brumae]